MRRSHSVSTLLCIDLYVGLAVSEGDETAPVFFTNTSGNMFLQPPGSTLTSESQVAAAAAGGSGGGNYATLDSDVGSAGYGVQGSGSGSGSNVNKGNDAKKVCRRLLWVFAVLVIELYNMIVELTRKHSKMFL